MATRIGVDIGGTYTDLIYYDDATGAVRVAKRLTTPTALEQGVLDSVTGALRDDEIQDTQIFIHGTTIGLNALLQGKTAKTALFCTAGFRDILEMRRGDREAMYDLFWRQPKPLVPRRLRIPVKERVRADGLVIADLDQSDLLDGLRLVSGEDVVAIAVCLINAYANPIHELRIESFLRDRGFGGVISLSHRLSREYREFERTSTTVVDASIRDATSRYLQTLRKGLASAGFSGDVFVTKSGGGAMTADEAEVRPFESIQSGPVAGTEGAAEICRLKGWQLGISADVGGTSFDACLIRSGRPHIKHEGAILGWPIQCQWVDVKSIGAGGGSIGYVEGGLLRVGPESAGASPGPACYDLGGLQPTVTDAALLLGMLGEGVLAGGLRLRKDLASDALNRLGAQLSMSPEETARGILTICAAAMAGTIREVTIGQGEDPRQARLIAFGGAGPLFATLLADELEIPEIVVPPYAGNFSAWGLLGQDVTYAASQTFIRRFDTHVAPELNDHLVALFGELDARGNQRHRRAPTEREVGVDVRYVGQDHTLTVGCPVAGTSLTPSDIGVLGTLFEAEYLQRYGTTLDNPLEVVTIRALSRVSLKRRPVGQGISRLGQPRSTSSVSRSFSFRSGEWADFITAQRADVHDETMLGPLILLEDTATTYVDSGWSVARDDLGNLILRRYGEVVSGSDTI